MRNYDTHDLLTTLSGLLSSFPRKHRFESCSRRHLFVLLPVVVRGRRFESCRCRGDLFRLYTLGIQAVYSCIHLLRGFETAETHATSVETTF